MGNQGKLFLQLALAGILLSPCLAAQPPACTDDPTRTVFAGHTREPCRQLSGNWALCESAYYLSDGQEAIPTSCHYVGGSCIGCGGINRACPLNTCDSRPRQVIDRTCEGEPQRTAFLGLSNGNHPCRSLDQTTSGICQNAFYVHEDSGKSVACYWESTAGLCLGCGTPNAPDPPESACPFNACDLAAPMANAQCTGDPGRTNLLGFGENSRNTCRFLDGTDQATCEDAFYEGFITGLPIACWWDGANCRGSSGGDPDGPRANFSFRNVCTPNLPPPLPPSATCPADPSRTNLLTVRGGPRQDFPQLRPCAVLDDTDQATCENAFYEHARSGLGIACWWAGGQCRGSTRDPDRNACQTSPPTPAATCSADPGRTLLGVGGDRPHKTFSSRSDEDRQFCRAFDGTDQATCESYFYQHLGTDTPIGCAWVDGSCVGCSGGRSGCQENACVASICENDPGRMLIGVGGRVRERNIFRVGTAGDQTCRELDDTDQTTCESAFYQNGKTGRGVACWWDNGICRGSTRTHFDQNACNATPAAVCTLDPRTNLLGFGGDRGEQGIESRPCRALDGTSEVVCEDAYYENVLTGEPVACWWNDLTELCLGSGGTAVRRRANFGLQPGFPERNACVRAVVEPAASCAGDSGRSVLAGFGKNRIGKILDGAGGPCRHFDNTDQPTCEDAYYENAERRTGVACWWDGTLCRGTSRNFSENDACQLATATCPRDPGRTNLLGFGALGFGGQFSGVCRQLDGTDQTMCENAYYENLADGYGVACFWRGGECRGSSGRHWIENQCLFEIDQGTADVSCESTPPRNNLLGFGRNGSRPCRALSDTDEATCEDAFYQDSGYGFAVACEWDGNDCRGTGDDRNHQNNVCPPTEATCYGEPSRGNVLGFGRNGNGNGGGPCRQFDNTSQSECEDAFYITGNDFAPVACWWHAAANECRGSHGAFEARNTCVFRRPAAVPCEGDTDRTNLLGYGGDDSGEELGLACRQLDGTSQATCENAYYQDLDKGWAVACTWAGGTDLCLGTQRGRRDGTLNECNPAAQLPSCSGDPTRLTLVGSGHGSGPDLGEMGGACRQLDGDQTSCEEAFYVSANGTPVACAWEAGAMECRGTRKRGGNTCATGTCEGDPQRSNLLGFGGHGFASSSSRTNACRVLDNTDSDMCENAFYQDPTRGGAVACFWQNGECRGCGRTTGNNSQCPANACATEDETCSGDPDRTKRTDCHTNDRETCESSYHVTRTRNLPPVAASCFWSEAENTCRGCGIGGQTRFGCVNTCVVGCGNGVVEAGEECDDGNMFGGDCCNGSCQLESDGAACTDRLFCTVGEATCSAGVCDESSERTCFSCRVGGCDESRNQCEPDEGDEFDDIADLPRITEGALCVGGETGLGMCTATGRCAGAFAPPTPVPGDPAPAPAMRPSGYAAAVLVLLALAFVALSGREPTRD